MSDKEVKIDFSGERLLSLASDSFDEGKVVDALKLLNQHDEMYGRTAYSLSLRANAYDDLHLYEESINNHNLFFAHIDRHGDYPGMNIVSDAYSDLVALYKEIGEDTCSKYYYAKMIICNNGTSSAAEAADLADEDLTPPEKPIFSDLKDEIDRLERVEEFIYDNKIDQALEELKDMKPTDKSYLQQKVLLGQCHLLKKNYDKAIEAVKEVIVRNAGDLEAGCILAQAYLHSGKIDEAREEVRRMISKNPDTDLRIQRVAYTACDLGMHKEAYDLFKRLHAEVANQLHPQFFSAVAAYNCEKYARSVEILDSLCTIHPASETAKYFLKLIRANIAAKGVEPLEPLPYDFTMPDELEQPYKDSIAAYMAGENHKATKSIRECYNFAVETYGIEDYSNEFFSFIEILDKNRQDDILEELLLNIELFVAYESEILCRLILRDEDIDIGFAKSKIYTYQKIRRLNIGKSYRKSFVTLYSNLVGRFNFIYEDGIDVFKWAVEATYKRLEEIGNLAVSRKSKLMFCTVFYFAARHDKILGAVLSVMEQQYNVTHEQILEVLQYTVDDDIALEKGEALQGEAALSDDKKED